MRLYVGKKNLDMEYKQLPMEKGVRMANWINCFFYTIFKTKFENVCTAKCALLYGLFIYIYILNKLLRNIYIH